MDPADGADTVTQIMPVIAPWPAPGHGPAEPVAPWFAADSPIRGVATVDPTALADPDQTVVGVLVVDDAERSGPVALPADSWDAPPALPDQTALRRRAGRPPTRVLVAVGAVLAALLAAATLPFLLGADTPTAAPAAAGLPTALDEPLRISADSSAVATTSVSGGPLSGGPVAGGPIASAAAVPPAGPASQPGAQTSAALQPGPPSNPAPAFGPIVFEAESGTRTGSAAIWDGYPSASGGQLVRNIGNWGGTPGTLRINNVNIPTNGSYTITIFSVHPDGERNRSATVTVSGNAALNVAFTGDENCCQAKVLSNITIAAGTHTITIANPTGHAPSIDRVVISRP